MKCFVLLACVGVGVACVPSPVAKPVEVAPPVIRTGPDACFGGRNGVVFVRWQAAEGGGFSLEDGTVSESSIKPVLRCFGDELLTAASERTGRGAGRGTFRFSRSASGFEVLAALRVAAVEVPEASFLLSSRREAVRGCVAASSIVRVLVEPSGRVADVTVSGEAMEAAASACALKAIGNVTLDGFGGPPTELEWRPHAD